MAHPVQAEANNWERSRQPHAGGLQAVLDEYAHLLKESLGVAAAPVVEMAEKISAELIAALTLRTAPLRVDEVTAPRYAREVKLNSEAMHIRHDVVHGGPMCHELRMVSLRLPMAKLQQQSCWLAQETQESRRKAGTQNQKW
jgi:hypothetical protein